MKTVYAISAGGSTMDVLGIFEDRAMAEEVIADWRTHMGVHDDGWEIEELTVWDRLPTHWTLWKMHAHNYNLHGDRTLRVAVDKEEIYEWSDHKPRETVVEDYTNQFFNIWVKGADLDDVRRTMQAKLQEHHAPAVVIP